MFQKTKLVAVLFGTRQARRSFGLHLVAQRLKGRSSFPTRWRRVDRAPSALDQKGGPITSWEYYRPSSFVDLIRSFKGKNDLEDLGSTGSWKAFLLIAAVPTQNGAFASGT